MDTARPSENACRLDDAAEALSALLRIDAAPVAPRLVLRPQQLATPHVLLIGHGIDATIDLHDGSWLAGTPGSAAIQLAVARWFGDWSHVLRTCWALALTVDDTLRNLRAALHTLPFIPADEERRDALLGSEAVADVPALLAAAGDRDGRVSPGIWGLTLALLIDIWRRRGEAPPVVEALPVLLQHHPVATGTDASDAPDSFVALCVDALFLLHWEVSGAGDDDREAVAAALRAVAGSLRRSGHDRLAARLAIDASSLAVGSSAAAAEAAGEAIAAAQAAADAGLVAFGRVLLATALTAGAVADASLWPRAFDVAEQAIDALAGLEPTPRRVLAQHLVDALTDDAALRPLCAIAAALAQAAPDPALWQPRVQHEPLGPWLVRVHALYAAGSPWFAVDDARAALQPAATAAHARADWTHWTVDHPAYRRVIPHHRSFLRERDFERNLLVLTHEFTHVLSLLGGVGVALSCLRTAALATELALWRSHADPGAGRAPGAEPLQRLAMDGTAPLPPGRSAALAELGQQLALHRKAQRLQAVWTPWFEGLAVYGETAADPLHDAEVIDPVNDALRNLVTMPVVGDAAAVQAALRATIEEFQQRSAAALRSQGAARLHDFLNDAQAPYWVGYLAVRAVVAGWRDTLARPLSATQAFRLLLHATRFDHEGMAPSLALGEADFAQAAEQAMLQWVQRLAALDASEIDLLTRAHEGAEPTDHVRWTRGHPARSAADGDTAARVAHRLRNGVEQALSGIADPFARAGLSPDELARHANQSILLGSFLPIGHAEASFHLDIDPGDGAGHLVLLLRTTEHHVDGGSSMNLDGVNLTPTAARELAVEVARSGATRIEVTRVIDLGGLAAPDLGIAGLHLFALRCGSWFHVHGATNVVDALLGEHPGRASDLRELLRGRLLPDRVMRVERERVASPEFAAVRAIEWLHATTAWDASAPDGEARAVDARATAERILLHERRAPKDWPLQSLASALLGDAELADRLASSDFRALTRELPEHRAAFVAALFRSAQEMVPDAVDASLRQALQRNRITILQRRPTGWDIVTRRSGAPAAT